MAVSDDRAFVHEATPENFEIGDDLIAAISGSDVRIEVTDGAGDTEHGLYRTAFAYLNVDDAEELADWIKAACARIRNSR